MCLDVSARGLSSESLACSSVCICYCESVSDIVHVYTDPRLVLSQNNPLEDRKRPSLLVIHILVIERQ